MTLQNSCNAKKTFMRRPRTHSKTRRFVIRWLAKAVLFVAGQFLGQAGQGQDSAEGTPTTATGELTVIQACDFANHRSQRFYLFEDAQSRKTFDLRFEKSPPATLRSGSKISVKGLAKGSEIVVPADGQGSVQTIQTAAAAVSGEQRTVVLTINFLDAALECSVSSIRGLMFTNAQSVDKLYQETSYGNVWLTGDVFGPYTINYLSTGNCDYNGWAAAAEAAAQAQGVNLGLYNRRVYVFPRRNPCSWAGLGTVGGNPSRAWIATCDLADVYAHELGHNLTMHHASTDTNNDGAMDCEYCDTSDFMGYGGVGFRQINAAHKEQMGWLAAGKVVNVTGSDIYYVAPLEYPPDTTLYPQALKIPKTSAGTYYYFSYRRKVGYDATMPSQYADRASVHHYQGSGAVRTYFVSALPDGGQFTDAANGISVTQLAHNNEFVTLQVSFGCSAAAPTGVVSPASQGGAAGDTLSYTITVSNKDTAYCAPTTFYCSPAVPADWSATISPSSLTLLPGQTGSATLTVTSPAETPTGSYAISVGISDSINPIHTASVTATCLIDSSAPTPPTNLKAAFKNKRVQLTWQTSTDNVGVTGYVVYRDGAYLGQTTTARYVDNTVSSRVTYTYFVTAADAAGNESEPSNSASITTGATRARAAAGKLQ
jgi:hypothetical protein